MFREFSFDQVFRLLSKYSKPSAPLPQKACLACPGRLRSEYNAKARRDQERSYWHRRWPKDQQTIRKYLLRTYFARFVRRTGSFAIVLRSLKFIEKDLKLLPSFCEGAVPKRAQALQQTFPNTDDPTITLWVETKVT